jgi:L-2,4-diaminobutyrate decarboxylase
MATPDLTALLAALEGDASLEGGSPFLRLAAEQFARTRAGDGPVCTARSAAELAARFEEPVPMGMRPLAEVTARLERDVLADVNRLTHPMYLGHQVSAPLAAAVWTDVVISAVNNSQAVREMSPTTTPLERRVITWMQSLAGFGPGAGGTLTSGGTEATLTALLAARAAYQPDAWSTGLTGPPPVLVHGEHTHYAVSRAAGVMGIGASNCVKVPSRDHRMDPDALAETLGALRAAGRPVLAVVATAGCTATGSFDDLERIADVCDAFTAWLHVDGAHGASALLSATHRPRVRGIARARSLAWDPHKMMLLPLAAGAVLVRDARDLARAYAQQAPYLFHETSDAGSGDLGPSSFQCSRRADAVKVWVALQRFGADGIGLLYEHLCSLTSALHALVAATERFEPMHVPESNILCFRYRADDAFNGELRERYNRSGRGWITATTLDGRRVLRVTIMNPRTTATHLDSLLKGLEAEAEAMRRETGRRLDDHLV